MGVEYPKKHDVSRVLLRVKSRLPTDFPLDEFAKISRELVELREPAMYGDDIKLIPSSALFRKGQAEELLDKARRVHETCTSLINNLKTSAGTK